MMISNWAMPAASRIVIYLQNPPSTPGFATNPIWIHAFNMIDPIKTQMAPWRDH